MVEWFKAAVLKTAVGQLTEGSNPSSSAICLLRLSVRASGFHPEKMGSIPIEDAILESVKV